MKILKILKLYLNCISYHRYLRAKRAREFEFYECFTVAKSHFLFDDDAIKNGDVCSKPCLLAKK